MPVPFTKNGKGLLASVYYGCLQQILVTMSQEDGVKSISEFSHGKFLHRLRQSIDPFRGKSLTHPGTHLRRLPPERNRQELVQLVKKARSEELSQKEVSSILFIHRVAMRNEDTAAIKVYGCPVFYDRKPQMSREIIGQKEIMV